MRRPIVAPVVLLFFLLTACVTTFQPAEEGLLVVGVQTMQTADRGRFYLDYRIHIDGGKHSILVKSWQDRIVTSDIPPGTHTVTELSYVFRDTPSKRGSLQRLDIPFEIVRGEVTFLSHELRVHLINADNSAGYLQRGRLKPLSAKVLRREYEKLSRDDRIAGFSLPQLQFTDIGGTTVNTAGLSGNDALRELLPEGIPRKDERLLILYTFTESPDRRLEILKPLADGTVWEPLFYRGKDDDSLMPEVGVEAITVRQAFDILRVNLKLDEKGPREGLHYLITLSSDPNFTEALVETIFLPFSTSEERILITHDYSYPGIEESRRTVKYPKQKNGDLHFDMNLMGLATDTLHMKVEVVRQNVPERMIKAIRKRNPDSKIGYIKGNIPEETIARTDVRIDLSPYPSPRWKRIDYETVTLIMPEGWKGFDKVEEIARILAEGLDIQYLATERGEYEREYFILSRWDDVKASAYASGSRVFFEIEERLWKQDYPWFVAFHETGHSVTLSDPGFRKLYFRDHRVQSEDASLRDEWWESWASYFSIFALRSLQKKIDEPSAAYLSVFSKMIDQELKEGRKEYEEYGNSAKLSAVTRLTYLPILDEASSETEMDEFIRRFFRGLKKLEDSSYTAAMEDMPEEKRNLFFQTGSAALISTSTGLKGNKLFHSRDFDINLKLYADVHDYLRAAYTE